MRKFPPVVLQKYPSEFAVFGKLDTPHKIQDFLDGFRINFETKRTTCRSPLMVLRRGEAHCLEGAMLAAAALWYHGDPPLLLDLLTTRKDQGHVVALFKRNGCWGAISKTNHAVLRYRDPVYKDVRELAMSYFNEYFLDSGEKTLRTYSNPLNLLSLGDAWLTSRRSVWEITTALDAVKHFRILQKGEERRLRLAHPLERKAGKLVEWKKRRAG